VDGNWQFSSVSVDYFRIKLLTFRFSGQYHLNTVDSLYLELLSISNKKLGSLDICVLCKLILSLYFELEA